MNVYILGAGASKAYDESPTGVRMPIAKDFFETFGKLDISSNPWVLIGDIVNYMRDNHGIEPADFWNMREDIEKLHSEIEEKLMSQVNNDFVERFHLNRAYNQLLFLFNSVINEIQNGPISQVHRNLAKQIDINDGLITFNWDTLMDRALQSVTNWTTDRGYYCIPKAIYRDEWVEPKDSDFKGPYLIKLHGSTNWITSYTIMENGKFTLTQASSPETFFVYEYTNNPFDTYDGRYMEGYQPFSYGYYPPNIPDKGKSAPDGKLLVGLKQRNPWTPKGTSGRSGLVSMPLIIPPVKEKSYNLFGSLFKTLWNQAEKSLVKADRIIIIGYSFPETDYQSNDLFHRAFSQRSTIPEVIIVNPNPEYLEYKFTMELGIPKNRLKVLKTYFDKEFQINSILR